MPRRYVREDFRKHALGVRHPDTDGEDALSRSRITPRQARRLMVISLLVILAFCLVDRVLGPGWRHADRDLRYGAGRVVSVTEHPNGGTGPQWAVTVEITVDGTALQDTVLLAGSDVPPSAGDEVGVSYVAGKASSVFEVRKLHVLGPASPDTAPDAAEKAP